MICFFSPRRKLWLSHLDRMVSPVFDAASTGTLRERLNPRHYYQGDLNRQNRLATSNLEAICRCLLGIGPWLTADHEDDENSLKTKLIEKVDVAFINGCDKSHQDWFCIDRGRQPLVDLGLLAAALLKNEQALWHKFSPNSQLGVISAFNTVRGVQPYLNNWILFPALIEAFLQKIGVRHDQRRIDCAVRQLDRWYVGDGFYRDGPAFVLDWYNSIMIHPLLDTLLRHVAGYERAQAEHVKRLKRFCEVQERCIAPDGTFPAVGRSITYRTGSLHALTYAASTRQLPDSVRPEQVASALSLTLEVVLGNQSYRDDGFLEIGVVGEQPALSEEYITTGSSYMAATIFLPLALPASDPFWSGGYYPWFSRQVFCSA